MKMEFDEICKFQEDYSRSDKYDSLGIFQCLIELQKIMDKYEKAEIVFEAQHDIIYVYELKSWLSVTDDGDLEEEDVKDILDLGFFFDNEYSNYIVYYT